MLYLCFSQNLNYALGWMVIHSLWQAFLITLIVGVVLLIWQKKEAKTRYFLANTGIWAVFLAAAATFYVYYDFSREPGDFVFVPDTTLNVRAKETAEVSLNEAHGLAIQPIGFSWEGFKKYCNNNMYFIVTLWFMGVVFFILKILGSISYVYYLRNRMNFPADEYWQEVKDAMCKKLNIARYVELVESAFVRSPIVVGHLKPMILFPIGAINRLNTNEVEGILAHELAHVMRHDYFFNILQNVIEALFYYHPAVWWLSSQIRTERENCCDDIAISVCGNAMTYAKSLVSVQEMAYYSPQMAMAFAGTSRKKQLLLRVQRVLNQPKSTLNIMEKLASTSILLLLLVGFVYGGNHFNNGSPFSLNGSETEIQNTDNQSNTQVFLKYDNNGEIDSLPVEKHVSDGNYSFENNLYSVEMKVKNQHVTAFKINGLEVEKKDMPKFQKMINELVANNNEKEDVDEIAHSGDESYKTRLMMVSDDGVMSEMLIDENDDKVILIHRPKKEPLSVSLGEDKKTIFIGGKKSTLTTLEKHGWTLKNKELQPIKGMENMNIQVLGAFDEAVGVPPPPPPAAHSYHYDDEAPKAPSVCKPNISDQLDELRERSDELRNQGVTALRTGEINRNLAEVRRGLNQRNANLNKLQAKLDKITAEIDALESGDENANDDENHGEGHGENHGDEGGSINYNRPDSKNDVSAPSARAYNEDKKAAKFDKWLIAEMKKDGYVSNPKSYSFSWTQNNMFVDGKNVRNQDRLKYAAMYQKIIGFPLGKNFTITRNESE